MPETWNHLARTWASKPFCIWILSGQYRQNGVNCIVLLVKRHLLGYYL